MTTNRIQYVQHSEFGSSLKNLMQKGGAYKKAAERVSAAWGRTNKLGFSYEEVFEGLNVTNHGESRIKNCVKYDLTNYVRLVTAFSNNICIFLFTGDHNAVDDWLNKNKGLDFIARPQNDRFTIEPVYVSDQISGDNRIASEPNWLIHGPVINQLPERNRARLLNGLDPEIVDAIRSVECDTSDEVIESIVSRVSNPALSETLLDALLLLRSGDRVIAKNRIDLYDNEVMPISNLPVSQVQNIISGESTVCTQDVDPILFEHFVKTADFKNWMLYLHPHQREFVDKNFAGPTRLAGVSGSGKTCVVIHRALRLAKEAPEKKILVITLNDALAKLIEELITAHCGSARPANLIVRSVFALCQEKLTDLQPNRKDYYDRRIAQRNPFAVSEHIDEIWEEYFHCQNNNNDAYIMFEVLQTLLARRVFPQDYLRQELDYIRSAFAPAERHAYLSMQRDGRVIPLDPRYREMVLKGLEGWERKMEAVGAIDDVGIVTALYNHLEELQPEFDHVLVDEVQDLGTLELRIIRCLTREGENDLFLCGDAAQTVYTKYARMKDAHIDLPSARWLKLNQNYRNSRQILAAAHGMLTRSFEKIQKGTVDIEILEPEFANFSSAKPLLLETNSIEDELAMALGYAEEMLSEASARDAKVCISLCGYSQYAVEKLAASLNLPALCGTTRIVSGSIFLSDLEQTKGFEFDLMIVLNCRDEIIPHPNLPENESFRELCKLYVALTRAKRELIVSFHGRVSRFIELSKEHFNIATWMEHVVNARDISGAVWPNPILGRVGDMVSWGVTGPAFLRLRDAVGLSRDLQNKILRHVTGTNKTIVRPNSSARIRQKQWETFAAFFQGMQDLAVRERILKTEEWEELQQLLVEPAFHTK